jgi:signal transduction histidine kinase/response regulator of citrate/malate metabolism
MKTDETSLEKLVMISEDFLQMNARHINYQNITDIFKELSGALFVALNIYETDGRHFTTVATSGLDRYLEKIASLLGFSLTGKLWSHDTVRSEKIKHHILNRFDNVLELIGDRIPAFIIQRLQQLFSVGETLLLKIMRDDVMVGDFTFFMPHGTTFTNEGICSIFSQQLGLLLTRKRAEEALLSQSQLLQYNLAQQQMLSDITLALNSLEDFDQRISNSLKKIGKHTCVSRVYIFEDSEEGTHTSNTYEWCNQGVRSEIGNLQNIAYSSIPSWEKLLKKEGMMHIPDLGILDESTRQLLESQNIKSLLAFPLSVNNRFFGAIGFDECTRQKQWTPGELDMLRIVSGVISHAFERRNMELAIKYERDKANRANQAKSEFLANMSHEIRTPMNAILGFSEALYQKLENKQSKKMAGSILSAGKLLLSLLNDILDLAKIEAGKLELRPVPLNLPLVLEETHNLYSEKARQKGLQMFLEVSDGFPDSLQLDETRIKQILFNLTSNAVKFTHQGHVKISAQFSLQNDKSGIVAISIEDTGIGIAADQVPMVFKDFSQLDPSANRKYEGTGLGLSICKKLTEKMHGKIWVESTLGKGSTFHVTLPNISLTHKPAEPASLTTLDPPLKFEKNSVMVVDDALIDIEMAESLLINLGLQVYHTTDAHKALTMIRSYKPNLLLLDTHMPKVNVYEMLQDIKRDPDTKHIPVLAYCVSIPTISSNPLSRLFDGYLRKPVNRNALISELKKFLPYSNSVPSIKVIEETALDISGLSDKTLEHIPQIIDELNTTFLPQWKQIKDQLVIFKIEAFGNQLKDFAKHHALDSLLQYGEKLTADAAMFDIESIKHSLERFPHICEQIKGIKTIQE